MPDERLNTVAQSLDRLEISRGTLYKLIRQGDLHIVKIGRATRIPESELERFVAERLTGVSS